MFCDIFDKGIIDRSFSLVELKLEIMKDEIYDTSYEVTKERIIEIEDELTSLHRFISKKIEESYDVL